MSHSERDVPLFETSLDSFRYTDTGCELALSCLACPLPLCKEDDPSMAKRQRREQQIRYILELRHIQGLPLKTIAAQLGISERTVSRDLTASRHE